MSKESDVKAVKAVIQTWLTSLDNNDLESMLLTCDDNVIVANERAATTVGVEQVRLKYETRMQSARFTSSFEIEHIDIFDNVALVVGHFNVSAKNNETGQVNSGEGRLVLGYQRGNDGSWKMILDIDNND